MSDARLQRLERRAKDSPRNRNPAKAIERARAEYRETLALARTIKGKGEDPKEGLVLVLAKGVTDDEPPFFEGCDECLNRLRHGTQTFLGVWLWHILSYSEDHRGRGSPDEAWVGPPEPEPPPAVSERALTDSLREAAAQSPTRTPQPPSIANPVERPSTPSPEKTDSPPKAVTPIPREPEMCDSCHDATGALRSGHRDHVGRCRACRGRKRTEEFGVTADTQLTDAIRGMR